ncbi:hypothetical protein [Schaalia hyovaginalis]|uniref:Uncharacterized protein n=1 Tax=Schaalia hyovaginalis TaxID=29316 RepID=A0A923IYT9_9ACTO|nr:hypothetical protein [Schaalia hyovaginalis]MBB6335540.1 hypothetical protein [Schaalia hyovaginalis]
MKQYEFKAVTAKSDAIMGLSYPAVFGSLVLAAHTGAFYSRPALASRTHALVSLALIFSAVAISWLIVKRIRKKLTKNYIVRIDGTRIEIREDGDALMNTEVTHCRLRDGSDRAAGSVRLDLRTADGRISFIARPREYRSAISLSSPNPFGTSTPFEVKNLLSLGREIEKTLSKKE